MKKYDKIVSYKIANIEEVHNKWINGIYKSTIVKHELEIFSTV